MEPHNHHRRSRFVRKDVHAHHKRVEIEAVTDVVYVTASPTGGGKVIGFTTLGEANAKTPTPTPDSDTTPAPAPAPTRTPTPTTVAPKITTRPSVVSQPVTSEKPKTTEAAKTTGSTQSVLATSSISESSSSTQDSSTSTFVTSTSAVVTTSESVLTSASATLSGSVTPTASSTGEPVAAGGGISTAATVGLAVAGVGIFLVLCSIIAFAYRRRSRKKIQEAYGKPEDEKAAGFSGVYMNKDNNVSRTNTITSERAPRVPSLRPVTQFLPNLTVTPPTEPTIQEQPEQRQAPVVAAPASGLTRSESRKAPPPALVLTKSNNEVPSAPISGVSIASSTASLVNKSQTSPSVSSVSTEYTDGSDSAVGTPVSVSAVGVVNITHPVHRVQMDFRPSMEDELELRVGQLVRLLKEYDDGWALCIRLDRSQQGVCPRTCLSQRPVKPRPQTPGAQIPGAREPPRPGYSPNSRSQSPVGTHGPIRPYSPVSSPRAQSPGSNGIQFPLPQSPTGYIKQTYRPATPTQQAQLRIIPAGPVQRPQSPATRSPVAQSPVTRDSPVALRVGPPLQITGPADPAPTPEAAPSTSASSGPKPQSPTGSPPRPAVAPTRPSPLSQEQTTDSEPDQVQPIFHAM